MILFPECREIIAQLKHLAAKREPLPIVPKLIDMNEAATILGISLTNFNKQEHLLPSKRKMVGHAVRYHNIDIVKYILTDENQPQP